MSTETVISSPAVEGKTERFDAIACLDERIRNQAVVERPTEPGQYLEVQGPTGSLTIKLEGEPMRIGRGLSAELRLDDSSVSRRHAILVPRPRGARILDDRSSNGTFVNGRRVQQSELRNGDVIVLGRAVLRYVEVGEPS
jgi:pSer/pThr/pTyr-binding forkhead associated (FHA) protein